MKIRTAVVMAMVLSARIQARDAKQARDGRIEACINQLGNSDSMSQAQTVASQMFKDIGVTLNFHTNPRSCPPEAIRISLTGHTPASLLPGALACAEPYEGVHLRIFWDRVQDFATTRRVPNLLAYVLVHEITHLVQGINRHSDRGVMKARWDGDEYDQMRSKRLAFTRYDVELIRLGLEARRSRAVLAKSGAVNCGN